jgi:hypothetical protein
MQVVLNSARIGGNAVLGVQTPEAASLSASAQCRSICSASLTTSISLSAAMLSAALCVANITTGIKLQASCQSTSICSASLTTAISLSASLQSQSTCAASLTTKISASAAFQCAASCSADMTTPSAPTTMQAACVVNALMSAALQSAQNPLPDPYPLKGISQVYFLSGFHMDYPLTPNAPYPLQVQSQAYPITTPRSYP